MSKVGKVPVTIPKGVKVDLKDNQITITGPKGNLTQEIHKDIDVKVEDDSIVVTRSTDQREHRSLHGLIRALIQNMVIGVSEGYTTTLELIGVGYRAEMKGKILEVNVGYSHPILVRAPDEVELSVIPKENKILIFRDG